MAIQQISVFLENRAGQLAEITTLLAENGIDLRAINIAETADYGVLRLIADDTALAAETLKRNEIIFTTADVVAAAVPDRPGGLAGMLRLISEGGTDVEYMYSVFGHAEGMAYMIFRVEDAEKLERLLKKGGVQTVTGLAFGLK